MHGLVVNPQAGVFNANLSFPVTFSFIKFSISDKNLICMRCRIGEQ